MCGLKLVVIAFLIQNGHLISIGPTKDSSAEILWNLSQMALQNKQLTNSGKVPSEFQLNPEKFSKYVGTIKSDSFKKNKPEEVSPKRMNYMYNNVPQRVPGYPSNIPNYPIRVPNYPSNFPDYNTNYPMPEQSFMGALNTIARNDRLQCVPRLLCELTSGPESEKQKSSILPFNINMESIVSLVSALGGTQSSPLLQFGKAALLGYSAKGNTRSCMYAFPECPQDPDKLIEYLNNYNGGFFRYFNGVQRPQSPSGYPNLNLFQQRPIYPQQPLVYPQQPPVYPQQPPIYPQQPPIYSQQPQNHPYYYNSHQYPNNYYPQVNLQQQQQYGYYKPVPNVQRPYPDSVRFDNNNQYAQKRIQTKPNSDENFYIINKYQFKFPNHFENENTREINYYGNLVQFPKPFNLYNKQLNNYESNPKEISSENSIFKFKPSAMIFPDRTGTGELRLDPDEFYTTGIFKKRPRKYQDRIKNFYDKTSSFRFPVVEQEF